VTKTASRSFAIPPGGRIAIAALLFSTGGAAIKFADLTGWQIASFRSGVAAIVLAIALPGVRRGITWRSALVAVAYAFTLVSFVLANRLTTSANTIYLQGTAPFFMALLAPLLLKEPLRRRDLPVLLAVLAGLVLVLTGSDVPSRTAPDPGRGNLIALGSGLGYALLLCGLRWLGRDENRHEAVAAVVLGNVVGCVATLPMALPAVGVQAVDWLVIGYLGAFQIGLAYLLITSGLARVPALEASLLLLIETALNPCWTWLLLGEVPSVAAIVGGGIIIVATAVQAITAARRPLQLEAT
jgi:drug/metabolite transporter (DMT)-like permease